jgi:hypothetical protein
MERKDSKMENLQAMDNKNDADPKLTKSNVILLGSTFVLGLIFNFLFFKKPLGISYPIFVLAFYGVLIFNLRKSMNFKLDFGWLLSIPVLMLSVTYLIFSNNVFRALNFLGIPILLIIQTVLITGNNSHEWHSIRFIKDFFYNSVYKTFLNLFKPFVVLARLLNAKTDTEKYVVFKKVVIGLIISLPLLLIIVGLLASADQIFQNYVSKIPRLFENLSIGEFIAQSIIVCIITLFSFGYIIGLRNKKEALVSKNSNTHYRVFDPVIVITVLSVINLIYIMFTVIQFSYLFGNFNFALPAGFTYSEYARRGFFELIFVTLINFAILLLSIGLTNKESKTGNMVMGILHSLVVFCTLVMLLSAHYRMSMYEEAYGYTYLRILTHLFMAFLFILFIITLYKIWNERISVLKPFIIAALVSYVIINYINIDVLITNENLTRYDKTGKIDVYYFNDLSYDAVYGLMYLADVKDANLASEAKGIMDSKRKELQREKPWQGFNFSEYNAKKVLAK